MVFTQRWWLYRGNILRWSLSHLWNLIAMWSLYRGSLCTEVVSVLNHLSSLGHNYYVVFVQGGLCTGWSLYRGGLRIWSLIKGFTLAFSCIKFWPFPFSNSGFHFRFPFPLFPISPWKVVDHLVRFANSKLYLFIHLLLPSRQHPCWLAHDKRKIILYSQWLYMPYNLRLINLLKFCSTRGG